MLNKANKVLFNIDELVWLVEVKIKYKNKKKKKKKKNENETYTPHPHLGTYFTHTAVYIHLLRSRHQ